MAKVFQYMLRVSGWEQVAAGVTANEAQVPQLVAGLARLEALIALMRSLNRSRRRSARGTRSRTS